jgi:hypothetical protein
MRTQFRPSLIERCAPGALLATAGIIHLALAPAHYDHAPAHGILFAIAGAVQVSLAAAFLLRPASILAHSAAIVSAALVALWLVTRFASAPFGHGSEEIDSIGLACKSVELTTIIAVLGLLWGRRAEAPSPVPVLQPALWSVTGGVVAGLLLFGVASAIDQHFPGLGPSESHEEHAAGSGEHGGHHPPPPPPLPPR